MQWKTVQPTYGGPYKALYIGTVKVGRVATSLSGGGYCAYCNLPGLPNELIAKTDSEAQGVEALENIVWKWLSKANLKEGQCT